MAVLDEYDREPVELQAHLAHVIGSRVGDVEGAFRLVLDRHAEDAWVLLQPLIKDRLVLLGGNSSIGAITEAPHAAGMVPDDVQCLVLGLGGLMDSLSQGVGVGNVDGGNAPGDAHFSWLNGLLGCVDRLSS